MACLNNAPFQYPPKKKTRIFKLMEKEKEKEKEVEKSVPNSLEGGRLSQTAMIDASKFPRINSD